MMGLISDIGAKGACDFRSDPKTLCIMEYEDWRPKVRELSEAEHWYYSGMANCKPTYTSEQLRPMTEQELKDYGERVSLRGYDAETESSIMNFLGL